MFIASATASADARVRPRIGDGLGCHRSRGSDQLVGSRQLQRGLVADVISHGLLLDGFRNDIAEAVVVEDSCRQPPAGEAEDDEGDAEQ